MRKGCIKCYFLVNSQKQDTLEGAAVMWCSDIYVNSWPTKWRKIINKSLLRSKEDISLPSQIQHENVILQAQRDVSQLQRCEDIITHLRAGYFNHARDLDKDKIIIIVRKHTTSVNTKYHDVAYYISTIKTT